VAKATATYVYMEVVEEGENENCQLDKVWYRQIPGLHVGQ